MEKEIHINSHIFSRNLAAKLSSHKYIIFDLLSVKGQPIFEITNTNSDVIKDFCKNHGNKFNLNQQRVINVENQFSLVFD
ncbi:MAG: hypothetical protein AJITA_00478 [Acetilactobacillus jinshanensis]